MAQCLGGACEVEVPFRPRASSIWMGSLLLWGEWYKLRSKGPKGEWTMRLRRLFSKVAEGSLLGNNSRSLSRFIDAEFHMAQPCLAQLCSLRGGNPAADVATTVPNLLLIVGADAPGAAKIRIWALNPLFGRGSWTRRKEFRLFLSRPFPFHTCNHLLFPPVSAPCLHLL
jgi:hypothetical protein